jgi:hypothetical protein
MTWIGEFLQQVVDLVGCCRLCVFPESQDRKVVLTVDEGVPWMTSLGKPP